MISRSGKAYPYPRYMCTIQVHARVRQCLRPCHAVHASTFAHGLAFVSPKYGGRLVGDWLSPSSVRRGEAKCLCGIRSRAPSRRRARAEIETARAREPTKLQLRKRLAGASHTAPRRNRWLMADGGRWLGWWEIASEIASPRIAAPSRWPR